MAQSFFLIPIRENGDDVDDGWFNILREAGVELEGFFGAAFIGPTSGAIANGQASPASIAGLIFDKTIVRSAIIDVQIRRVSTTGERISRATFYVIYNTTLDTWFITPGGGGPDETGVDLSILPTTGQLQYISDTMSGTYDSVNSKISFTARTLA